MATFKKWTSTVLVNGQPEPNVKVYVFSPGTTDQIPIYEDEGVTPITQPILTDSQGRYAFFVDVDTYPSAAAGTFLSLSDTPSSYVGRGGDVVLVKTTEDGIETQPWPVTGTILNFFLSDDAADIGSYYYMYPTESGDGYSELTSPSLSTGDDQLLWAFVTEAGEPGVEVLALGAYTTTLFLKKTGNKDVRVYWKLFKRDTEGTETEILQSAVSDYLTADNSQYLISAYLNEDQVLDPTDRLVLKLFANVSGTGTDVTVTLTMEGDYDSRLVINVLSSAFNLDRLSDVTISSPADNEVLAYDSGSGKWINQTAAEAGILAADGSVPLTADWDVGDGRKIFADQIRARDAAGLKLTDDEGRGIYVTDGGLVGIGTESPGTLVHMYTSASGGTPRAGTLLTLERADTTYLSFLTPSINTSGILFANENGDRRGGITYKDSVGMTFFVQGAEQVRISDNGDVGIGITAPGYDLDVSGDIHCTGKLTSDGGNDPPYVLYNPESRVSIINRVKKEVLPDKLNGAVLFFNVDQGQLEIFLPSKGEFQALNGEVLETVDPITQTFETEDRYYLDEETGEIKNYQAKKRVKRYRLKPDHELDPLTGKVKRKIKEKKKDPKTGKEIEEVVGEEEVAPEEAIELVEATKNGR